MSAKNLAKKVLGSIAPNQFASLLARRADRQAQSVLDAHNVPAIAEAIVLRYGRRVLGGPFEGMEYISKSAGSSLIPKIIGSYESELYGAIRHALERQ